MVSKQFFAEPSAEEMLEDRPEGMSAIDAICAMFAIIAGRVITPQEVTKLLIENEWKW